MSTHAEWLRSEIDKALTILDSERVPYPETFLIGRLVGAAGLTGGEITALFDRLERIRRGDKS